MADTTPNALEVAKKLDHLASHLVSDRSAVQQAAELIRAQHAALAASQPDAALADEWISVDERLPMQPDAKVTYEQKTYLVTDGDRVEASDFARGSAAGKPWACWSMYGGLPASHITHWRPLPAPPTLNASGEVRNVK